ncbi:hypothetical protein LOTGIDRAFT_208999 [Lottia gigantea]|uniref:Inosine/uridine-preferring nucleoside hydrolase domain-containing protein n=1 Tax=Lottia gigantea TaxID=225164 RepID=V4AL69_LOTGI|nr:hypothetical protein LOTGIDRAFT_208999 [Lottia gigantea]ESO97842.1 hypothetical protein LOTGIDRAFT_208999 [Lottia gigantea]
MKKLIIDVDTGVDDAMALLHCIGQSKAGTEVLAITCVNGNVGLDRVLRNTLRTLQYADKSNIPVYRGAVKPLIPWKTEGATHFHGNDGLGDAKWDTPDDISLIQSEHAVHALIRLVKEHPGEITLVTLAPLTNIALALQLDETFSSNLKEVMIMGGNIEGKGNVSLSAEFNFHVDPEAAAIVLQDLKCPVTMVTWETCIHSTISEEDYEKLLLIQTPRAEFFRKISDNRQHLISSKKKLNPGFRSCDWFAAMVLFDESLCLEYISAHASVELQGRFTRGQMVVDWLGRWSDMPNVKIAMRLDRARLLTTMRDFLSQE